MTSDVLSEDSSRRSMGDEFKKGTDNDISQGPVSKRGCTDILFLILFIMHWVGLIFLAVLAFQKGDPQRLFVGKDFNGQFCGVTEGVKNYPKLYWTLKVAKISDASAQETSDLLQATDLTAGAPGYSNFLEYFNPVCVTKCPCYDTIQKKCDASNSFDLKTAVKRSYSHGSGISVPALDDSVCPYAEEYCVPSPSTTVSLMGRFCVPDLEQKMLEAAEGATNDGGIPEEISGSWTHFVGDMGTAWPVLPVSLAVALVLGLSFLFFLRFCAGAVVWTTVTIVLALFVVGGFMSYSYAGSTVDTTTRDALTYTAYVIWGLAVVYLLLIFGLRKRIRLGIAIVKTAAMFMYNVPTILLMPVIYFIITLIFYAGWITVALYLMSAVDETEAGTGKRYSWNVTTQRFFAYHFFSLLWNNAFLVGLNQVMIAGAVGIWYFSPVNASGNKIPTSGCVLKSAWRALRYHMGSVAFGSFILAVIQFIKWTLRYLAYQAGHAKTNRSQACAKFPLLGCVFVKLGFFNSCYATTLSCLSYLVACFERCIKFLNKNAYIQVALLGKNFCKSAFAAFSLIVRNAARIAVLGGMGFAIRLIGLLGIVSVTGVVGWFMTAGLYGDQISSPMFPTVVFVCGGFVVACVVMDVYGIAIDSILQCFVADEEMHGKGGGGQFTPKPLQDFIGAPAAGGCC